MRSVTKENLITLAELIAEEYDVEKLVDSHELLEISVHTAEENDLPLSRQVLTKYQSNLKKLLLDFDIEEPKLMIETKTVKGTIILYSDGTYEFKKPESEVINPKVKIPEYSMFIEGEDRLIIRKGTYRGHTIEEVDTVAGFSNAKKGWAKWCLKTDTDLTEDDREVFQKIILGQI